MSNDKTGENPVRRKPKVSWGRLIRPGLVDPKARPKGVVDGDQVNIPEPIMKRGLVLEYQLNQCRKCCRQIRSAIFRDWGRERKLMKPGYKVVEK